VTQITVSETAAGKTCPYCRFPLKEGARAVRCGECGTVHHEECWQEGGGCAVLGCVDAGARAAQSGTWPTAASQPWGASPIEAESADGPAAASRAGRNLLIGVAAALSLAAVAAGAFIALRHGSPTPVSALQTDQGTTRSSGRSRTRTVTVPAQQTTVTTVETQTVSGQATQPATSASVTVTYPAPPPLPSNVTGTDSRGYNTGPGCSDDVESPLPGCNDSPSQYPRNDPSITCRNGITVNQITTSCGLAEKVYNAYRTDGIVTAISDRQAYEFRCFTGGPGTTHWTNCVGRAGSIPLYLRWKG